MIQVNFLYGHIFLEISYGYGLIGYIIIIKNNIVLKNI